MYKKCSGMISFLVNIVVFSLVITIINSNNIKEVEQEYVLRVENTNYTLDDLRKFMYLSNEAEGDISKTLTSEEKEAIYMDFIETKIYAEAANSKHISYPEENSKEALLVYKEKESRFAEYGITAEDYLKYAEDNYKMITLMDNFSAYYDLPEDLYNEFKNSYSGDDLKTYSFRTMRFYYEEPEYGEVVEDRREDFVRAKAETALVEVNNGGDFEKIAEEQADGVYTIGTNGLVYINGDLEHAIGPTLESKLGSTDLYNKVKALKAGEVTEIVLDKESTAFFFTKLETVEDGFVGEADKEVREELLMQLQESIILEEVKYEENMSALIQFVYN